MGKYIRHQLGVLLIAIGSLALPNGMAAAGAISGTVTEAETGDPITSGWVRVYDSDGSHVDSGLTDSSDGSYQVGGLNEGTYFARTSNTGFFDELWNGIPCPKGDCTVTNGTQIELDEGGSVTADFALGPGAKLSGTVTEVDTGDPITSGWVRVYDSTGSHVDTGFTDFSDGVYQVGGLDEGTYFARTSNTGFFDELWDGHPCPKGDCVVANGDPIGLGEEASETANFELGPGAIIKGTVTEAETGDPITSGWVRVYDSIGSHVDTGFTDSSNGTYQVGGLDEGTYFARTSNTGFFDELWDGNPCPQGQCVITDGDRINLDKEETVEDVNFALT